MRLSQSWRCLSLFSMHKTPSRVFCLSSAHQMNLRDDFSPFAHFCTLTSRNL